MENRKIFIILDTEGLNIFIQFLESLVNCCEIETPVGSPNKMRQCSLWSVLIPPTYLTCDNGNIKWINGIYEWALKDDVVNNDLLLFLKEIGKSNDSFSISNSDVEFMSDILHHLADELPVSGSCILEVYLLVSMNHIPSPLLCLISALKRLELSYQAFFGILCNDVSCIIWDLYATWIDYIDFHFATCEELLMHCKKDPIWGGTVSITFEKYSSGLNLQYYFLTNTSKGKTLNDILDYDDKVKMTFGSKIEIVALVSQENLPMHLICPDTFFLYSFTPWKCESFDFFNFCSYKENTWCLGFLKYDICNESVKVLATDWISYVSDDFTHNLSSTSQQVLRKHFAVLFQADRRSESITVYFFKNSEQINVLGFLELSKCTQMYENKITEDDPSENAMILNENYFDLDKNAAHLVQPWEWCEKNSWYLEENMGRIMKSIGRCKSDDFYMQGIMIPSVESVKEGLHQDSFLDFMSLFDNTGRPKGSNFQAIQVIPDRLLNNIKAEKDVKHLPYSDAVNVIGHGIEYCIDSKGAIRLDQRLLKVQKRLIPQDTMNLTSTKIKVPADSYKSSKTKCRKESVPSNQKLHKHISKKKESRADRHKRRLQTIVEGTVAKYGQVSSEHTSYKACCDKLFEVCLLLVKQLKSSKDLNGQMKQFAKEHVNAVVTSLLTDVSIT